ncbi:hypothetical protein MY1884_009559 [Beauveria asiatica]
MVNTPSSRKRTSSTRSASTVQAALVARPAFSTVQPSNERDVAVPQQLPIEVLPEHREPARPRGAGTLHQDANLGTALPTDAQSLFEALSAVRGKGTIEAHEAARRRQEELCRIVTESIDASNEGRIRPTAAAALLVIVSSTTGSSHASGPGGVAALPAPRPVAAIGLSAHEMVNYVVALQPSDTLRALIAAFLLGEPKERDSINQTRVTCYCRSVPRRSSSKL